MMQSDSEGRLLMAFIAFGTRTLTVRQGNSMHVLFKD